MISNDNNTFIFSPNGNYNIQDQNLLEESKIKDNVKDAIMTSRLIC